MVEVEQDGAPILGSKDFLIKKHIACSIRKQDQKYYSFFFEGKYYSFLVEPATASNSGRNLELFQFSTLYCHVNYWVLSKVATN
jgi:hypothetical protein